MTFCRSQPFSPINRLQQTQASTLYVTCQLRLGDYQPLTGHITSHCTIQYKRQPSLLKTPEVIRSAQPLQDSAGCAHCFTQHVPINSTTIHIAASFQPQPNKLRRLRLRLCPTPFIMLSARGAGRQRSPLAASRPAAGVAQAQLPAQRLFWEAAARTVRAQSAWQSQYDDVM